MTGTQRRQPKQEEKNQHKSFDYYLTLFVRAKYACHQEIIRDL